jgi:hypothetical protein
MKLRPVFCYVTLPGIGATNNKIRLVVKKIFFYSCSIILLHSFTSLQAQDYKAIHGSSYAGALGAANNPASIVHVPFAWDVSPLALQLKQSTNLFTIHNFSLLSPAGNVTVTANTGNERRFLLSNQDIKVLNARIRLNENAAIAFGASVRSYVSIKTSNLNWQDTIANVRDFMRLNMSNSPLSADSRTNGWAEVYGSYARTVFENDNGILNAGITVKVNRGLAGSYLTASGFYQAPGTIHNQPGFLLSNGLLEYGYSSSLDAWDSSGSFTDQRKLFLKKTYSTIAFSIGAEYIIPAESENFYDYDLKIGASLLDIGFNNFQYSNNSRSAVLNRSNVSDSLIQATFEDLQNAGEVPDSLQRIAGSVTALNGNFNVFQPARLVLNVDKHLAGNFFINGDLTIPLSAVFGKKQLFVRDMNLLTLTPRLETRVFGFYLPASFNTEMQFWLGGALKAGPLLLGVHNWANLFSKNKSHNGGAYLAITFRPGRNHGVDEERGSDSRTKSKRIGGKKIRQYDCPARVN